MPHNHITIYSSGIADIQRGYAIPPGEPTKIALSVQRDHIGDVLGSLNIFGPVTLVAPPVYAPANESQGNLEIDSQAALASLAVKLAGAKVQVQRADGIVAGTLVGLHRDKEELHGKVIEHVSLVVLTSDGLARVAIRDVQRLKFLDDVVTRELDKMLVRSFSRLKPDSTLMELELTANEPDAEAILQYTVPAAAWKISYRLREQADGTYELQGFAIVDNHTDDDWNDVYLSVVTGEPITFSTDLALTKLPRREHVNLVQSQAMGALEMEEAMPQMVMMAGGAAEERAGGRGRNFRDAAMMQSMEVPAEYSSMSDVAVACYDQAEVREVGDFSIYHSQTPVSIGAHRSALVPIFTTTVGESRTVLFYKESDHAERAFRAVEFTNSTSQSLGRGVCAVLVGEMFMGSCILPATPPRGDALLIHSLETGVRFQPEVKDLKSELVGVKISDGACLMRRRQLTSKVLRIRNNRDEAYKVVIDHTFRLNSPAVSVVVRRADGEEPLAIDSKLKRGVRLNVSLAPREQLEVVIAESKVQSEQVALVESNKQGETLKSAWLMDNIVATNGPLANDPAIRTILEIESRLRAKGLRIGDEQSKIARLSQRQERLRKNIATGGQDEQTAKWRVELGQAEQQINELEESTIPALRAEEQVIVSELRAALLALVAEWEG
jgi:hypothetical protein